MLKRYLQLHAQNFVGALGRLVRQPVAATLTGLVIAIALALPAGLRVIVNNADVLSESWQSVADFTVYLDFSVSEQRALELAGEIDARGDVARVEFVTRDDALEEFRLASGFGSALDAL
ncbi:MAG TPA: permease-like cell division protein FtsX, partial [Gammaproteobacteria bacterium]|nr:permease-like cell division protein FtsX [Gammaproteobacteria bacterium]